MAIGGSQDAANDGSVARATVARMMMITMKNIQMLCDVKWKGTRMRNRMMEDHHNEALSAWAWDLTFEPIKTGFAIKLGRMV